MKIISIPRRMGWIALASVLITSCLQDFGQFQVEDATTSGESGDSSTESSGDGDTNRATSEGGNTTDSASGDGDGDGSGGTSGGGDGDGDTGTGSSTSGDGDGDIGGAPGTGGADDGCGFGAKRCGTACVADDDPNTGCAETSCSPCESANHATVGCDAGECAVISCDDGYISCDGDPGTGCEHSPTTFTETSCGGCNADCTSLGLSNCQSGQCGCAQATDCQFDTNKDVSCSNRLCSCNDSECNVGETCRKNANTSKCSCAGGAPCQDGWVCCPGSSNGSCKQLDGNDASNCGACGWTCPDGHVCSSGTCVEN